MTSSSSSTTATTSSSNTHGTYSSGTSSSSNQIYPRSTPSDLLSSSTTQASLFSSPTSPTKLTSSEIRSRKRTFPSSPTSTTPSSSSSSTNDTSSSSLPSSSSSSTTTSSSFKKLKSFLSPPPVSSSLPFTTPHPPPLSSKDLLFQFPSSSSSSTFSKYLQFMDKDQLISILLHLANSPVTQTVLSDHVPVPTVGFILQQLLHLEKKVVEALPYTRISALSLVGGASTTPTTSTTAPMYTDYALNRVRPILNEVQSTLLHFLDYFFQSMSLSLTTPKNPHHPGSMTVSLFNEWVRFLYESTCLVTRLPDFEPTTSTTSWSGKEGRGEWKYHPFTQTLLDTLKQYWQATFLGIQSQVVPPLRSEDLASIEKWYSCLEDVNLTTRGYFQDLVVSFEPWLRSTHGSSTFVSCGLFHQPTCGNAVAVLGGGLGGGPMSFESHPSSFTSHGTLPMTSFASSSTTHSSTFQTSWLWSTTSTHRALEPTSVWQETHSQSQG